jgi:adenylate cyclase
VGLFLRPGPSERRLLALLEKRRRMPRGRRKALDRSSSRRFFRKRAVVFTDMADFTVRAAHDGILHFLMIFRRAVLGLGPVVARARGEIVKVEADSLLLRFDDVASACRGIAAMQRALERMNRGRPANERIRFSYGVGYGDVLDLEDDVFGLEVNLASKLGEDLARPGEVLLTPAAAATLDAASLRRLVPHRVVTFGKSAVPVSRLRL